MAKELYRYPFSQETRHPERVYLVKRAPRPEHHRAPFHPVLICSRKHTMKWEAGWSGNSAWVWGHEGREPYSGWLLERWNGFDIDYGHIVRSFPLPDGSKPGFFHQHDREPWTLLDGAVWWSHDPMPHWLADLGVAMACDHFTRGRICEDAGDCFLSEKVREKLWARRRNLEGKGHA